ncbi:hypothetical protein D9619_007437 [Psilocybe cf. subviscida]|uniref:Uncharacterized protein n=1 Tax=Psilocybe cf. subviscida TaxID=2480587 RepID=A0A8H5B1L8_9AGAR|nr:hypothetical protein D9619_007437 [Psilocybe cf. subviscida]
MADIIRYSKPGSDWKDIDLKSFNIQVIDEPDVAAFFGIPTLPVPNVSEVILNNVEMPNDDLTAEEGRFFKLLDDANYESAPEAQVDDFAYFLLEMLGFSAGRTRRVHTLQDLKMFMCGSVVRVRANVAVTERVGGGSEYILLVQDDKQYLEQLKPGEPEPQLVAYALAAFHENNESRARDGQPPILAHTFPAVIMIGTAAVFYKIPITYELAHAVGAGTYPEHTTIVQKFQPPVDDLQNYLSEGMANLGNRRSVLACYEALKRLVLSMP